MNLIVTPLLMKLTADPSLFLYRRQIPQHISRKIVESGRLAFARMKLPPERGHKLRGIRLS